MERSLTAGLRDTVLSADLLDEKSRRMHARVGQVVRQKWRIDTLLGVGGMAAVYSATHRNGHRVAIKILHAELCLNDAVRTRFLREAYVANRVEHPGAVSILDDDVAEDGAAFLVMELLQGETLELRWRRMCGLPDPLEILAVSDQVLDTLAAAHARGIIHRDLKPSNLFLTNEGRVKVLDFGIAHLHELSATGGGTLTGVSMGTPAFMPPEQARGRWELVDARSDVWALGATLFTALSGRFVHEADTINEQLLAAMTRPSPSVATVSPSTPRPVVDIIDRALAFDRDRRWQDAREMQKALREACLEISGQELSPATIPRVEAPTPATPPLPVFTPSSLTPASTTSSRGDRGGRTKWPISATLTVFGTIAVLFTVVGVFATAHVLDGRDDAGSDVGHHAATSAPVAPTATATAADARTDSAAKSASSAAPPETATAPRKDAAAVPASAPSPARPARRGRVAAAAAEAPDDSGLGPADPPRPTADPRAPARTAPTDDPMDRRK